MASRAKEIRGKGVPITFVDGSTAYVRFGLPGVAELEERFGSIGALRKALSESFDTDPDGMPKGKAFGLLWELLVVGLRRYKLNEEELEDRIDPARISEYIGVVMDALAQGLGGGGSPKEKMTTPSSGPSRGKSSTTTRPSLSVAATSSSGG